MVRRKSNKAKKAAQAVNRHQPKPRPKIIADGRDLPARSAVLSTMELLEFILHDVDMVTVLCAQAVNKKWEAVIKSSPLLQRDLFFAPALSDPGLRTEPLYPPLPLTPSHQSRLQTWLNKAKEIATDTKTQQPTQNPLLKKYFGCFYTKLESMSDGLTQDYSRGRASEDVNYITTGRLMGMAMSGETWRIAGAGKPTAFLRAGASWRRMLVSQPPPRRVEHVLVLNGRGQTQHRIAKQYRSVEVPDGLTMGQLYDLVYAITFDRPTGRLSWVGWPDGNDVLSLENPHHWTLDSRSRCGWVPGSRLGNMSKWIRIREPRDENAVGHNWASTNCVVIGEEDVGTDFQGFCHEHGTGNYDTMCATCTQSIGMWRLKARKRRLRKEVSTVAPFFRCEEYRTGSTLIEEHPCMYPVTSDDEAGEKLLGEESSDEG